MDSTDNKGEVIIYQTDDGLTHIDVRMEDETVWLTQQQISCSTRNTRTIIIKNRCKNTASTKVIYGYI